MLLKNPSQDLQLHTEVAEHSQQKQKKTNPFKHLTYKK